MDAGEGACKYNKMLQSSSSYTAGRRVREQAQTVYKSL